MRHQNRFLLCVILLLATLPAAAQTAKGVATINGGRNVIFLGSPIHISAADSFDASGFTTIYSNLGTGNEVYNGNAGSGILGTDAGLSHPQRAGFAFTPTGDFTVNAIRVGASHVSGPNSIILTLQEDDGRGRPGTVLHLWQITGLPTFGSCCRLLTATSKHGVAVKKDTQYWVVLRTESEETYDVWDNDFGGESGAFSNNVGNGWLNGGIQQQGAFGVFGK